MDPQQLLVVLSYTFSPDQAQRKQAEDAIKTLPTVEGAPLALLQIVGAKEQVGREVRQAAAVSFKNIAKSFWEPLGSITGEKCVPTASKPAIRDLLFQALLVETDKSVRDLLAESVHLLVRTDYPAHWPGLLPDILACVQSGDPLRMHNALLALRKVVKRLEYKMKEDRGPLEAIVGTALPLLEQLVRQLLETQNNSLEAALIMKLCLKIVWSCTQFSLPNGCGDGSNPALLAHMGQWIELIGALIAKPLPEASEPDAQPAGQPEAAEERAAWPWWKLKKWALQITQRWFHRYGMPQYADDESRAFAAQFSAVHAPALLEPVLAQLSLGPQVVKGRTVAPTFAWSTWSRPCSYFKRLLCAAAVCFAPLSPTLAYAAPTHTHPPPPRPLPARKQGRYCTDRCTHLCLVYVESAVQLGSTYKLLKPHMGPLLREVLFPQLCLKPADLELFESDPLEFVAKQNDPMEDFTDPKMSAMTLLESVMKYRKKDNLDPFLGFLTESLNEYAAAPPELKNARKKEGVMVALGCLAELLKKNQKYAAQLEPMLVAHVFPEFKSPVGFLRARAASLTQYFYKAKFSDFSHVALLLQHMLEALRDPCLPVQVEAANGLRCLIELKGTEALITPVLPQLLNEYFRIMGEIGSDSVVSALETIIDRFGDELAPHAALLVQKLAGAFLEYASEASAGEGGEGSDEAAMAACGSVDAITTVLSVIVNSDACPALLAEAQPFLLPVLALILDPSGDNLEYLESGLEILTFVTYYSGDDGEGNRQTAGQRAALKQAAASVMAPYVNFFPALVHAFHNWAYDYIEGMMSPIDNMIGCASDLFLQSVEPTSGQSFVMLTLSMVDKVFNNGGRNNGKESICATHLLLSLLHNGMPAKLDSALGPIMELTFARLNPAPKATEVLLRVPEGCAEGQPIQTNIHGYEASVPCPPGAQPGCETRVTLEVPPMPVGPKLKTALLQVVASAFYYNPMMTLAWLEARGDTASFFNAWFVEMDSQGAEWGHLAAKLHVLALSSLVALPPAQLPNFLAQHLAAMLAKLVAFTKAIEDDNKGGTGGEEGEEEEGEDDDEDDDEDEDDEDEDVEDGEDDDNEAGDGDAADKVELAYQESLKDMMKGGARMRSAFAEADEDEDDLYGDEDDYSSPIDDVDQLLLFFAALQHAQAQHPDLMAQAQAQLPPEAQAACAELLQKAHAKQAQQAGVEGA
eukprot:CAMPEP_0172650106 /NCGR_PEP_ID=MMETSP1068-20121228/242126_1 /TAXON_ID=35684 /ORGANISM="Pseudopedinella elastica, Strain CCMP716" /LENGTH=1202 /DNA_ID=CAMNT_0013464469 /DNA_START=137 /DNA_END=3746 /DNA_ORIENTATION=+